MAREQHIFPMKGRPPCSECKGPEAVVLNVSDTGYSVTSQLQHEPMCSELRCSHGIPWLQPCSKCEADRDSAIEADDV